MKRLIIIVSILVLGVILVPLGVSAKHGDTQETTTSETTTNTTESEAPHAEATRVSGKQASEDSTSTEVKRERLGVDKLKICEKRQTQVNTIMDRVVARSKTHFERITTASERAQVFYVKQGNVLANYGALVATASSTKIAAQAAIDALSSTADFTCTSDAPKSDIQEFKTHRVHKIEALSAYRDAVKALIKGIKSVQPVETTTSEAKQ